MSYLFKNWPFWFLIVCKNVNKPADGQHGPDNINYQIPGNKGDMNQFRSLLRKAKNVLIITGAGVSEPSGIPTLDGPGAYWRKQKVDDICSMKAFQENTSSVWEYFHYFRELCRDKKPNKAHKAIADYQKRMMEKNLNVTLVTLNIDGLHQKAGSPLVVEFHGNTFETICMTCNNLDLNYDKPICPALEGREKFTKGRVSLKPISGNDLPRCKFRECKGLLRPNVVWFGEDIPKAELLKASLSPYLDAAVKSADLCLVIGTSSKTYPTAAYGPVLQSKKIPVAEFNKEETQFTMNFRFHFNGSCVDSVPAALAPFEDDPVPSDSSSYESLSLS